MNTDNKISRIIIDLLLAHGVKNVIASPGSRNAPLLIAAATETKLTTEIVADERSAAFVALGMSVVSQRPVALICTSGTAVLNYAPAIAEAYYRHVPLIVISADRPMEWIDQDDSQTIHQPGALGNFVKQSYDIPAYDDDSTLWYVNRIVNDALILAETGPKAPVHINVQLREPLNRMTDQQLPQQRVIQSVAATSALSISDRNSLIEELTSSRKVLIIAGFGNTSRKLEKAISKFAVLSNTAILAETISNLHSSGVIRNIDTVLSTIAPDEIERFTPDIVITFGGALVSRHIKQFLRSHRPAQHWHVGYTPTTVDCFMSLTKRIEMDAEDFFGQLSGFIHKHSIESQYSSLWSKLASKALMSHQEYVDSIGWSDMKAFSIILPAIPRKWNLQLSNGTPVRYAQLFGTYSFHRVDCNRGVSGIDGCTSTALGASLAYSDAPTLLISGDLSAAYDIGILSSRLLSPKFKMIVINNSGGGIFRFIANTRDLPMRERLFCAPPNLPLDKLAEGYGLKYFRAEDESSLRGCLKSFLSESAQPAIMEIVTPPEQSADILKNYFSRNSK